MVTVLSHRQFYAIMLNVFHGGHSLDLLEGQDEVLMINAAAVVRKKVLLFKHQAAATLTRSINFLEKRGSLFFELEALTWSKPEAPVLDLPQTGECLDWMLVGSRDT